MSVMEESDLHLMISARAKLANMSMQSTANHLNLTSTDPQKAMNQTMTSVTSSNQNNPFIQTAQTPMSTRSKEVG